MKLSQVPNNTYIINDSWLLKVSRHNSDGKTSTSTCGYREAQSLDSSIEVEKYYTSIDEAFADGFSNPWQPRKNL